MDCCDLLSDEQGGASILPMVVDNGEVTVCSAIAGGRREIHGMPDSVGLMRWTADGRILMAHYQLMSVDDCTGNRFVPLFRENR